MDSPSPPVTSSCITTSCRSLLHDPQAHSQVSQLHLLPKELRGSLQALKLVPRYQQPLVCTPQDGHGQLPGLGAPAQLKSCP